MNKAIIFDMDGVLIDSECLWVQAEKDVFTSLGVRVSDANCALTKSMTTSEVTRFWYEKYPWGNNDLDSVEQMVIMRVIGLIQTQDCQIEGVKKFIESLKSKNYKIGLATNSPEKIIYVVLHKLDVLHLFDTVSSAEHEIKGKPDPSIYINTAEKLAVKPENCIVVEDSYSGMLAAKSAGMKVVAFTNGNYEIDFDIADYKIDNFIDSNIVF